MDRSSFFIKDRGMFGSFPNQESVNELEEKGVRYFVDLTFATERKIIPYKTNHKYISYPIKDRRAPINYIKFACFVLKLVDIIFNLEQNELLYLHCKGGHGRSGVVVSVLLCHIFGLTPEQALEHTTLYHSKRRVMRDKWRKIGSPQTYEQKKFIYRFCKELTFYKAYKTGHTAGFSNFSPHTVLIKGIGLFPTSEAAMQAHKCLENKEYVQKQLNASSPTLSRNLGKDIIVNDWLNVSDQIMFKILKHKFDQHQDIKYNLLKTGLRPIILHTKYDRFWGDGYNNGLNKLGKQLNKA